MNYRSYRPVYNYISTSEVYKSLSNEDRGVSIYTMVIVFLSNKMNKDQITMVIVLQQLLNSSVLICFVSNYG